MRQLKETFDIVVNIQGDEPLIEPEIIDEVVDSLQKAPDAVYSTPCTPLAHEDVPLRQRVKCIVDVNGYAIYFSRGVLPHNKKGEIKAFPKPYADLPYLLHLGLQCYDRKFLAKYAKMPHTPLQLMEDLEQLKVCWRTGTRSRSSRQVDHCAHGVDEPEDVKSNDHKGVLIYDETASAILANTPKLFSLAVDGGAAVAQSITDTVGLDRVKGTYAFVVATKDWHQDPGEHWATGADAPNFVDTWPVHCGAETPGAEFHDNLDIAFTFTWTDNHDVWEFKDEASYNACNFAGAVEKASTSVKTVDISPGTTAAQTRYYGCSVGSHCDDGQKIAISWTDADGCLSHENYECDSNCDGSCDECNEGCDDGCNSDCDEDYEGNYCSSWEYGCNYDCDSECNSGCDEDCDGSCDGSCDDSCSCKDADAAAARAVSSGAALLALAALLL